MLWSDNPFFPKTLNQERLNDLKLFPERYDHVWNGGYAKVTEGAYFASELAKARDEGRIGKVSQDPLLAPRAYSDIGGSGDRADAMAIWIAQFIDQEIRLIDYIEGQGQVLGYYTSELRARGYDRCECYLPHDGVNSNIVTGLRFALGLGITLPFGLSIFAILALSGWRGRVVSYAVGHERFIVTSMPKRDVLRPLRTEIFNLPWCSQSRSHAHNG